MPKYFYSAVDINNKKLRGTVDAKDDADLRKILRGQNIIPIKYGIVEKTDSKYRIKANEAAEFSRQMASMLGSGITVARAMEIIKDRDFKPQISLIYNKLHKDTLQGYTMSEAMTMQGRVFPELLINMYASGEASGQLEHVCSKMANHYDKEHRLNGKVQAALTYPTILFFVTVVVVMLIFTLILPQFFNMFGDMDLPFLTTIFIGISKFLQKFWYIVIIGMLIMLAIFIYLLRIPSVAQNADRLKLKIPVTGKLLKIIYTARFARTLSSLYSSGLSMINALEISSTVVGNKYIESQFAQVIKNVRNGEPLSETISKVDGFDKKLSTTILIGEESGRLDAMLESSADAFDYEAEMATTKMVALIEPVMLVVMAVIIGTIMLAVVMPLLSMYQNVGNL